jgi:hypothetical protein
MKTVEKNIQFLLIALFLIGTGMLANGQPKGSMQRFKEEKIKYFNDKLNLSEKESDQFWPIYEDLQNRNMKIHEDEKSLLNYFGANAEAMSEKEIDETITKFMDILDKRMKLTSKYHDKFVRIIGKRKTMHMYALEREFRLHVLEKFRAGRGHGEGDSPRRNKSGNR